MATKAQGGANTQRQTAGVRAAGRNRRLWSRLAFAVFLVPVGIFLLPTTMVLAIVVLPTFAAYLVDRTPNKALTTTVGLLNAAGSLPAVISVWGMGHTVTAAMRVLGDPVMWMAPYLAAALGWIIFLTLPVFLRRYYETATQARIAALRKRQAELRDAWGNDVAGDGEDDPSVQAKDAGARGGAS